VDATARSGEAPVCRDLLERWTPTTLDAGNVSITADTDSGDSEVGSSSA
jgi:hypothetical protein